VTSYAWLGKVKSMLVKISMHKVRGLNCKSRDPRPLISITQQDWCNPWLPMHDLEKWSQCINTLSPLVAAPFEVFGVGVVCMNDLGNDYLLRCFNPVNNHLSVHQLLTFQKFHGSR
jgi:hypothetical protein